MNIVWRLLAGLALLLSFGVLTAWAWDKSDALNNGGLTTPAAVTGSVVDTAAR